ncbi:MAG: hypothetical protein ACHQAY_23580 [Hyphomicrobiales bacterium]
MSDFSLPVGRQGFYHLHSGLSALSGLSLSGFAGSRYPCAAISRPEPFGIWPPKGFDLFMQRKIPPLGE